jgi:hypothetical protein
VNKRVLARRKSLLTRGFFTGWLRLIVCLFERALDEEDFKGNHSASQNTFHLSVSFEKEREKELTQTKTLVFLTGTPSEERMAWRVLLFVRH